MILMNELQISGFRSIENTKIEDLQSFNVFTGRNSSGKSNILRALNLFFNDEVEPGKPFDFQRDFHSKVPQPRKKKRIEISAKFTLPSNFKLRKELTHGAELGGVFVISKSWELNERREVEVKFNAQSGGKKIGNPVEAAKQILASIWYRYIPNHSNPTELLKRESQALAISVLQRMTKEKDDPTGKVLSRVASASDRMIETARDALTNSGAPLKSAKISTAKSLAEMLSMSGFQATTETGALVNDADWGAGHQAFFLFQVLREIDTNYGGYFGWRQATIWGVEEPESTLHRDLETKLASQLRDWSDDARAKLQILGTSHSPVMSMAAEAGFWTNSEAGATMIESKPIAELIQISENEGVAGWTHPVLFSPLQPVVLVEGYRDFKALSHACKISGKRTFRITYLPDLDKSEPKGGKDNISGFLKRAQRYIANRLISCPLIVALDWDVSDGDLRSAQKAYGKNGEKYVIRLSEASANPELGTDFCGIERFYPTSCVAEQLQRGVFAAALAPNKTYSVSKTQLDKAKDPLLESLVSIKDVKQIPHLVALLKQIESTLV